jgi:predicted RNase H-like nuclease
VPGYFDCKDPHRAKRRQAARAGRDLSQEAFGIGSKIKQVDDAITPETQQWVFEVHPEVCFWALNGQRPMTHNKKNKEGAAERLAVLSPIFPKIGQHLGSRPSGVGKDDLLDAAVAAWTALRIQDGEAQNVCEPESDSTGLSTTIWY